MLILSIDEAQVGMSLAAPVLHPEQPDQELLKRGYVLETTVIQRLKDMDVDVLYVDYPALEDLDRHLAPQLSPERQALYTQIKHTIQGVQRRSRPEVPYGAYYSTTRDFITTILQQGQNPIYLDHMARLPGDAVGHATAVAHVALMLGLKLESYLISERSRLAPRHARETVNLGVAGMLHDIGKTQLPPELQERHGLDMPEEPEPREQWMSHTQLAYDMVRGEVEASAASAILHHHQHYDGTGFPTIKHKDATPAPLEAKRIHVFSRILMLADLYDRLGTSASKSVRRSNLEIHRQLRTAYAGWCDPVVLRALQGICPPFPPGTRVGLSDGSSAVVVGTDAKEPYRPQLKRFVGEEWNLDPTIITVGDADAPTIITVAGAPVEGIPELTAA